MPIPDGSILRRAAPAKINLTLRVVGRRDDGYHLLQSLVAFTAFADTVTLRIGASNAADTGQTVPDETLMEGPFADRVDGSNLVDRARDAFRAATGWTTPSRFEVAKRIPTGAGLGGGSADAAATLRLLNQAAGHPLDDRALVGIGLSLGADVPVCLISRGSVLEGIGETIRPIDIAPLAILLVHPGIGAATPAVFGAHARHYSQSESFPASLSTKESAWRYLLERNGNDLELAATSVVPAIGEALEQLRRRVPDAIVRMSGSGSACFALSRDEAALDRAAVELRAENPGWWVERTHLRSAAPETERVSPP